MKTLLTSSLIVAVLVLGSTAVTASDHAAIKKMTLVELLAHIDEYDHQIHHAVGTTSTTYLINSPRSWTSPAIVFWANQNQCWMQLIFTMSKMKSKPLMPCQKK